jgi:hypothetical protein
MPLQIMRGESVSDIGQGYGSKSHLLRYLGWHRLAFAPQTKAGWSHTLDTQAKHLGLPRTHELTARIHRLFLPVRPR